MSTLELENIKHPDNSGDNIALASNGSITIDRKSTDGTITEFRKDGTAVGSIDVDNGDNLTIQGKSDHSGLQFGTNAIFPHKNSANIDATIDLGEAGLSWKDLYLSGGVYLGGTTSANKLTDYEQGTWTPVDTNGNAYNQAVTATYVKIGKLVYIYMDITSTSNTQATNNNQVAGLPFPTATSSNAGTISQGYNTGNGNVTGHMYGTSIYLMNGESTNLVLNQRIIASGVYHTDS